MYFFPLAEHFRCEGGRPVCHTILLVQGLNFLPDIGNPLAKGCTFLLVCQFKQQLSTNVRSNALIHCMEPVWKNKCLWGHLWPCPQRAKGQSVLPIASTLAQKLALLRPAALSPAVCSLKVRYLALQSQHIPLPVFHAGMLNQLFSQSQSPLISQSKAFCRPSPANVALLRSLASHAVPSCLLEGYFPSFKASSDHSRIFKIASFVWYPAWNFVFNTVNGILKIDCDEIQRLLPQHPLKGNPIQMNSQRDMACSRPRDT